MYIIDENNEGWYPNFGGGFAGPNDEDFDPSTLYLYELYDLEDIVFDEHPFYLRAIWATDGKRPATYLFGFDTSNLVEIALEIAIP